MHSAVDPQPINEPPTTSRLCVRLARWNRRLHYLIGLFLLFFLWLFATTGLVLNHPEWSFAESWSKRTETRSDHMIKVLDAGLRDDLALARQIMGQLDIEGEILWTTTRTNLSQFDFQTRRPGHFYFIKADLDLNRVTLRHSEVNLWGVTKALHVFSGVSLDDSRQNRDWKLTWIWALSMDACAAGSILIVFSSLYMWWERPETRRIGIVVLSCGSILCGLFVLGLRWIF